MTSISIIMPVRNAERFLAEAMASALSQAFRDFELIVVLDRSTDRSQAISRALHASDARVRILENPGEGLVDALNAAAGAATGDLLARLDADDRMSQARLQRQHDFLLGQPETVAVGSSAIVIDAGSRPVGRIVVPTADAALRARLMRGNPFVHSSMVMRRAAFIAAGRYRHDFPLAEDYDLWLRLARLGRLANIAEPLVDYRRHENAVSVRSSDRQRLNQHLCILEWKRQNALIDAAAYRRLHEDLLALFGRTAELAGRPEDLAGSDLALFVRLLPHLGSGEARRLSRLVAGAGLAGRMSAAAVARFRLRAALTSRVAYRWACRAAVRRLAIDNPEMAQH